MLKQSSSRMKKVLAILLIAIFVVSVAAAAVSAAKQLRKGHAGKNVRMGHGGRNVRTGHTAVVRPGRTAVVRTGHHRPRAHYFHGHRYPRCDWVWSSARQNWVWIC